MHLAEKFQTHRAGVRMGAVQDKARRGDDAVAAFFLNAGQAGEEFVRHVLAQPGLAEGAARNGQNFWRAVWCYPVGGIAADAEQR